MTDSLEKKCPICEMELEEEKDYPEEFGKKFCSEGCREEYRKKMADGRAKPDSGCGCCH
jgi:YHS domain-containing protein